MPILELFIKLMIVLIRLRLFNPSGPVGGNLGARGQRRRNRKKNRKKSRRRRRRRSRRKKVELKCKRNLASKTETIDSNPRTNR